MNRSVPLALHQLRYEQRIFWRTPAAVAFGFAMPLVLLVIFATINETQPISDDPERFADEFVPGMIGFGVASACYGNLSARFVYRRESGLLLRVRATPVPVVSLIGGYVANAVVVAGLLTVSLVTVGAVAYDLALPGRWWLLAVAVAIGAVACCALGLAVSTFVPDVDAIDPVVFGSLLPVAFLSGVFTSIPADSTLGRIGAVFPLQHQVAAVRDVFDGAAGVPWAHLAIVAAWGSGATLVALRRFRWEPSRR